MSKLACFVMIGILVAACYSAATPLAPTQPSDSGDVDVRTFVESFGASLQMVSLLAPDAAQQIEAVYAPFVSPELLAAWMTDPATAPGRLTSSPWPDRIEIDSITSQPDGSYLVSGSVIEITSAEIDTENAAAQSPVEITVRQIEGQWRIAT
jgi:hypothetical protein